MNILVNESNGFKPLVFTDSGDFVLDTVRRYKDEIYVDGWCTNNLGLLDDDGEEKIISVNVVITSSEASCYLLDDAYEGSEPARVKLMFEDGKFTDMSDAEATAIANLLLY